MKMTYFIMEIMETSNEALQKEEIGSRKLKLENVFG